MEEINKTKPNYKRISIIQYVLFFVSVIGLSTDLYFTHTDVSETRTILESESSAKRYYISLSDSLKKQNTSLSQYKTLTMAMIQRDVVTNQLKYKVGDIVLMKNDSAKVIINDIIIGGGKYNYYVKFRVLCRDNTEKEIIPELIY